MNFSETFLFKNRNSTYEFTLKEGPKVKMKFFWRTKSWRKILDGLKRKVGIFIGNKNIFNLIDNVQGATKIFLVYKRIENLSYILMIFFSYMKVTNTASFFFQKKHRVLLKKCTNIIWNSQSKFEIEEGILPSNIGVLISVRRCIYIIFNLVLCNWLLG